MFELKIPSDWSPEQALAVYELLDDLQRLVAERYQRPLAELMQADRQQTVYRQSDHDIDF